MADAPETLCSTGCGRPARKGGLCWACRKQRARTGGTQRTHPTRALRYGSLKERFLEASHALADADTGDDDAFQRALWRMENALAVYRRRGKPREVTGPVSVPPEDDSGPRT